MSHIMKVLLLLAVTACVLKAQLNEAQQMCLCQGGGALHDPESEIQDIQMHKATVFCNRVEIVVTTNSGRRYCLSPRLRELKSLLRVMLSKKKLSIA